MKVKYLILGISLVVVTSVMLVYFRRDIYRFTLLDSINGKRKTDPRCDMHCVVDKGGEVMDVYDCCECSATVSGSYEPTFHKCMCDAGYGDFCYIPVTNFLLSQ
jgi:hypothetical protein